jgi:hypothetical protein
MLMNRRRRGPIVAETDPIVRLLLPMPAETVPLWAQLFLVHASLGGPTQTCVTTCQVLAGGLTHLGFTCEAMAAAVLVSPTGPGAAPGDSSVGVIGAPPIVRDGGTTNGHMVVWVDSMARLVDPTVAQEPRLEAQAQSDPLLGMPSVLPVKDRDTLLATRPAVMRGAYRLVWHLYPEWTDILDGVLTDPLREGIPYASLNLAHKTVNILRHLAEHRDPAPMLAAHPHLHDLLSSTDPLPALPPVHTLSYPAQRLLQL